MASPEDLLVDSARESFKSVQMMHIVGTVGAVVAFISAMGHDVKADRLSDALMGGGFRFNAALMAGLMGGLMATVFWGRALGALRRLRAFPAIYNATITFPCLGTVPSIAVRMALTIAPGLMLTAAAYFVLGTVDPTWFGAALSVAAGTPFFVLAAQFSRTVKPVAAASSTRRR
ncbi:MAG: hypothetical protein ACPGQL_06895 [Thermoplasmatota archaeon]